jgi:hypothetical protein
MLGHGGPKNSRSFVPCLPRKGIRWAVWAAVLGSGFFAVGPHPGLAQDAQVQSSSWVQMAIRVTWTGAAPRKYTGLILLTQGQVLAFQSLATEPDAPCSVWLETPDRSLSGVSPLSEAYPPHAARLVIRPKGPRHHDGVDLWVEAPSDGTLLLGLWAVEDTRVQPKWLTVSLQDLTQQIVEYPLDDRGTKLVVRRKADDLLRIEIPNPSLVFRPGEMFHFRVRPNFAGRDVSSRLHLHGRLSHARDGKEEWRQEFEIGQGMESLPLGIRMPNREGVYEVTLTLEIPSRLPLPSLRSLPSLPRLPSLPPLTPLNESVWSKSTIASRKLQVVVLDDKPPQPSEALHGWTLIAEFDPGSSRWRERSGVLPQTPRLLPLGKSATDPPRGTLIQEGNNLWRELAPAESSISPTWELYPLPVEKAGLPHCLELEFPCHSGQELGVGIIEPGVSESDRSLTIRSGIIVPERYVTSTASSSPCSHSLIFWPQTKYPQLVLINLNKSRPARFGRMRLSVAAKLPSRSVWGDQTSDHRIVAAYFSRPTFAETFGGTRPQGNNPGKGVDDWVFFYEGATRLVDYLKFAGYNGLCLVIYADGSGLYPSELLRPTPRYDTGTLSENSDDPSRKDVAELVFRLCDRSGLAFIPGIELTAPIPDLEKLIREGGPAAEGILLEGVFLAGPPGPHPRYNPLHPKVQEVIEQAVTEILERYAAHPSFRGVALQLTPETFTHLPGPAWPLDAATIRRFQQETSIHWDAAGEQELFQRAVPLVQTHRDKWLAWRGEKLAQFYARLAAKVAGAKPHAMLYLLGPDVFSTPDLQQFVRPRLPQQATLAQAYVLLGLDVKALAQNPHVVIPRPQLAFTPSDEPLLSPRDLAHLPDYDRLFEEMIHRGSLLYHPSVKAEVAFGEESGLPSLLARPLLFQIAPVQRENSRRFALSVAGFDPEVVFDGGWHVPLSQDEAQGETLHVIKRLPGVPGIRVTNSRGTDLAGPIVIRRYSSPTGTQLSLTNPTPISLTASLHWQGNLGIQPQVFPSRVPFSFRATETGTVWSVRLEPYQMCLLGFPVVDLPMQGAYVSWPSSTVEQLRKEISGLYNSLALLRNPPLWPILQNPGFEISSREATLVPGWLALGPPEANVRLDSTVKRSGNFSLFIRSPKPLATVVSHPFPPPQTGRVTVRAHVRGGEHPIRLRLCVEGRSVFGSVITLGETITEPLAAPSSPNTESGFQIVDLEVTHVPSQELVAIRLRFDLLDPGEVWLDDLLLSQTALNRVEMVELMKLVAPAETYLNQGRFAECLQLLESPWARFLRVQFPEVQSPSPQEAAATVAAKPNEPARDSRANSSNPLTRLREWLPRGIPFF